MNEIKKEKINNLKTVGWIKRLRAFLLRRFKNPKIQTLIEGLISYEMISYVGFGILTALVDFGSFWFLLNACHIDSLVSNIISTVLAIIFAYVTNRIWVFKSNVNDFKGIFFEFFKFAEARIFTLVLSEFILFLDKFLLNMPKIAKIIGLVLTVILNYVFSKLFIFKDKNTSETKETTNEKN